MRVQRKRTKGFKLPPNTVCVSRPSKWGNPFDWRDWRESWPFSHPTPNPPQDTIGRDTWCKNMATQEFKDALATGEIMLPLHELRGKNLACWCRRNQWCHGDILLDLANSDQAAIDPRVMEARHG